MKNNFLYGCAVLLALGLPLAAHADKLRLPADAPPAFQTECASCHLAFPPQLMVAEDWQRVMATLDKHYGDNASLDEKTRSTLESFLVRNAGSTGKVGAGGTATNAGEPPRMTATAWFKRKHHEVSRTDWTHAKVKSPANCIACHTRAAEGSYREREITMPNGRRWEN
jgi:hypothetical protein